MNPDTLAAGLIAQRQREAERAATSAVTAYQRADGMFERARARRELAHANGRAQGLAEAVALLFGDEVPALVRLRAIRAENKAHPYLDDVDTAEAVEGRER